MVYSVTCPNCNEENAGHELQCVKCGTSLMGLPRQLKHLSASEQSAVQDSVIRQQVALAEEKIKIGNLVKGGADNFFWIAGLSLVNSISLLLNSGWSFFIGLGITRLIDGISIAIASEASANVAILIKYITFGVDVGIAGIFVILGFLARRHKWAFVIGMVLYALDSLVFLIGPDLPSIGFHLLILYWLYLGLKSLTKLRNMEQTIAVLSSTAQP